MWKRIEDVPPRLRRIGGVELTLDQSNMVAAWADDLRYVDVPNYLECAIASFRRTHKIENEEWVPNDLT